MRLSKTSLSVLWPSGVSSLALAVMLGSASPALCSNTESDEGENELSKTTIIPSAVVKISGAEDKTEGETEEKLSLMQTVLPGITGLSEEKEETAKHESLLLTQSFSDLALENVAETEEKKEEAPQVLASLQGPELVVQEAVNLPEETEEKKEAVPHVLMTSVQGSGSGWQEVVNIPAETEEKKEEPMIPGTGACGI